MEARIIPLSSPVVNWMEYLNTSSELLGRSITASLDAKRLPVGDLAAFISTLAEFRRSNSDPERSVESSISLQKHIFFSFIIIASKRMEVILRNLDLTVTTPEVTLDITLAVVSGTMDQWRAAISEVLKDDTSIREARTIFGNLYRFFCAQGLAALWPPKSELKDGTFLLTSRRF